MPPSPPKWSYQKIPADAHSPPIHLYQFTQSPPHSSFPYSKFNIPLKVLYFSKAEYREYLSDSIFTETESLLLLEYAERFELNFIIVREKLLNCNFNKNLLKIVNLRNRYFQIQERLIISRFIKISILSSLVAHTPMQAGVIEEKVNFLKLSYRQYQSSPGSRRYNFEFGIKELSSDGRETYPCLESLSFEEFERNSFHLFDFGMPPIVGENISVNFKTSKLYDVNSDSKRRRLLKNAFNRSKDEERQLAESIASFRKLEEDIERISALNSRNYKKASNALNKFKLGIESNALLKSLNILNLTDDISYMEDNFNRFSGIQEEFHKNCIIVKKAELEVKRLIAPTDIFPMVISNNILVRGDLLLEKIEIPLLGSKIAYPLSSELNSKYKEFIADVEEGRIKGKDFDGKNGEMLMVYLSTVWDVRMSDSLGKDKFFINSESVQCFYEKFCVDLSVLVGLEYKAEVMGLE